MKEYRASRVQAARLVLLSALMTGAGLFVAVLPMFKEGHSILYAVVGWIGIVFFGSGLVAYMIQLVRPTVVLRIDETGVSQAYWLHRLNVKWDDVAGLALNQRSGAGVSMLLIALRDVGDFVSKASTSEKFNVWTARTFGFGDAWINLTLLDEDPAEVFEEARRIAERHGRKAPDLDAE